MAHKVFQFKDKNSNRINLIYFGKEDLGNLQEVINKIKLNQRPSIASQAEKKVSKKDLMELIEHYDTQAEIERGNILQDVKKLCTSNSKLDKDVEQKLVSLLNDKLALMMKESSKSNNSSKEQKGRYVSGLFNKKDGGKKKGASK